MTSRPGVAPRTTLGESIQPTSREPGRGSFRHLMAAPPVQTALKTQERYTRSNVLSCHSAGFFDKADDSAGATRLISQAASTCLCQFEPKKYGDG